MGEIVVVITDSADQSGSEKGERNSALGKEKKRWRAPPNVRALKGSDRKGAQKETRKRKRLHIIKRRGIRKAQLVVGASSEDPKRPKGRGWKKGITKRWSLAKVSGTKEDIKGEG